MERIDRSRAPKKPGPLPLAGMERPDPARGLVRLLGFVLGGPVTLVEEGDRLLMQRGSLSREVAPALLSHCLSQGLLAREGDRLRPLAPARPLLKRLLTGGAESHRAQHGLIATEERLVEGERRPVTVNRQESVLGTLALMKDREGEPWFSAGAVAAGERLARDFTFAGLQPRMTARWEPRLSTCGKGMRGGQAELSDHQIDARRRLNAALEAVGPELSGAALDVCCFGKGLEQVERERQWPARSAKLMLRTALQLLARHYGIGGDQTAPISLSFASTSAEGSPVIGRR